MALSMTPRRSLHRLRQTRVAKTSAWTMSGLGKTAEMICAFDLDGLSDLVEQSCQAGSDCGGGWSGSAI